MDILTVLFVVVTVLLFFGASIFFHEFGHYWVARRLGLKVEAFAIGFGPKIFAWTRDGIEYSVRWIPAGGFVKLPQMITSEALEGEKSSDGEPVPPAHPFSKILVALAGPVMNVIFAFVIATVIYYVGLPLLVNPSVIGYVEKDSPEAKLGIKSGDRVVAIDGKPVSSWQQILMETALAPTNVFQVSIQQGTQTNVFALTAKPSDGATGIKLLNLGSREHPVVGSIESGMPAEKSGLKVKDKFVTFDGINVVSQEQLQQIISSRGGKSCEMQVERDGKTLTFTVVPTMDKERDRARIGIGFAGSYYQLQKPGPLPWVQIEDVLNQTYRTLYALFHSKETGVKPSDLSGPVGILTVLAQRVLTDYRLALSFLVLLNINLAVLNLLPIPVLDGGHILMSIVEQIRGRPMSARFVEYTTTAFALMLISFMLFVTYFDIRRMPYFKMMFQQQTRIEQPDKPQPADKP